MPVAESYTGLNQHRRGSPKPNEDRRSHHSHDGHHGVHGDAQRTMVRIALYRMGVHYLEDSQQRHKQQTHHGCNNQSLCLWSPIAAVVNLSSRQRRILTAILHINPGRRKTEDIQLTSIPSRIQVPSLPKVKLPPSANRNRNGSVGWVTRPNAGGVANA